MLHSPFERASEHHRIQQESENLTSLFGKGREESRVSASSISWFNAHRNFWLAGGKTPRVRCIPYAVYIHTYATGILCNYWQIYIYRLLFIVRFYFKIVLSNVLKNTALWLICNVITFVLKTILNIRTDYMNINHDLFLFQDLKPAADIACFSTGLSVFSNKLLEEKNCVTGIKKDRSHGHFRLFIYYYYFLRRMSVFQYINHVKSRLRR